MKFVFEPHKILGNPLNHLKEEIRVDTNFMLKTHSQIAVLRWEVRAEVGLAEPGCRVSFHVFELLSRCVFGHQFA